MTGPTRNDAKRLVRRHWNGRAATFDDESHHGIHGDDQRERWLAVLREWTGDPPLRVLDVGCGTGMLSLLLARLGHDVTGVDFAPEMVGQARRKARDAGLPVEFVGGDAETLPVADDGVDLVAARHLLWTLPDPEAALREWRRVVRPGGRVALFEGYWDHPEPWEEYREARTALPLFDGRPPDGLVPLLESHLVGVEHGPLTDPVLWGHEPRHEYYVAVGDVPE